MPVKTASIVAVGVVGLAAAALLTMPPKKDRPQEEAFVYEAPKTSCETGPAVVCDALDTTALKGSRYRRVELPTSVCTVTQRQRDGGTATLHRDTAPLVSRRFVVLKDSCVDASAEGGGRVFDGGLKFATQKCFCRKASGACNVSLQDGGTAPAPFGSTVRDATGPGCQPKSCYEFLGESSWDARCPGG